MTQTVLITGCSTGFGEATARLFAAHGWNVVATMRRIEAGVALAKLENVLVTRLDVEDAASIDAAIAEGIGRFGSIDVLVNNAGYGLFGIFEETPREKITEQFAVNVFGLMDVTRGVLPHFRQRRSGVIINISSGAGVFALPMIPLYNASKFALEGFSESLSYELSGLGIRVKVVEPGGVLSTGFGARTAAESSSITPIGDYAPFKAGAGRVFEGLRQSRGLGTAEGVAKIIFEAATDNTDRLRYVATEDIKPLIAARRETSEDTYLAFMRERFLPVV